MDTNDRVMVGHKITAHCQPWGPIPSESSKFPRGACAGVDHSKVQVHLQNWNASGAADSCESSGIPDASHFSPINFDSWADISDFGTGEGSNPVIGEHLLPETQLQPQSPGLEFHEYDPNMDYDNIKWGQLGFYDFSACYYPRNWSIYARERKKPTWSIQDNSEYSVLLRKTLAEFKKVDARLENINRSSPPTED